MTIEQWQALIGEARRDLKTWAAGLTAEESREQEAMLRSTGHADLARIADELFGNRVCAYGLERDGETHPCGKPATYRMLGGAGTIWVCAEH